MASLDLFEFIYALNFLKLSKSNANSPATMKLTSVLRSLRTESLLFCFTLSFVLLLQTNTLTAWIEYTFQAEYHGEFNSILSAMRCLATLAFFALVFPDTRSIPLLAFSTAAALTTIGVFQPQGLGVLAVLIEVAPLITGAATAFVLALRDEDLEDHDSLFSWETTVQTPRKKQAIARREHGSKLSRSAASLVDGGNGASGLKGSVSSGKPTAGDVTASRMGEDVTSSSEGGARLVLSVGGLN